VPRRQAEYLIFNFLLVEVDGRLGGLLLLRADPHLRLEGDGLGPEDIKNIRQSRATTGERNS